MNTKTILLIAALLILSPVQAGEWKVTYSSFTNTYDVSDGVQNPIHYKTERAANKAAKVLNKNEKKNEKASGFIDNGDCPEGVLC